MFRDSLKKFPFFFLLSASLLSGCSRTCARTCASIDDMKGTYSLNQGDYEGAIENLEKAVQLQPSFPSYRNHLSEAYAHAGEHEKMWTQAKLAVLSPYKDDEAQAHFENVCDNLFKEMGIDQPGVSYNKVISELGLPDGLVLYEETMSAFYGTCKMTFGDSGLLNYEFIEFPKQEAPNFWVDTAKQTLYWGVMNLLLN